jgi:hypothetical protein
MLNSSVNMPTNITLYVSVSKPMNIKKTQMNECHFPVLHSFSDEPFT